jgi:hypothetical protein
MCDGNGRWFFRNPPSGNLKPMDTGLLGHPVIPPRHGQVDNHKIQAPVRNKGIKCTYSKVFEDQSDTYHDIRTHYLMEKEPSLMQDKPKVMDAAAAADKVEALKGRKDGPSRAMLKSIWLSVLHV